MSSGEDGKNGNPHDVGSDGVSHIRRGATSRGSANPSRNVAGNRRQLPTVPADMRSGIPGFCPRYVDFIARCLTYIPSEFKEDYSPEVIVLNYLARMADVHEAFPHMARNAAEPYGMIGLIP